MYTLLAFLRDVSAGVVHLGLFGGLFVGARNSKTVAPIDFFFTHKKVYRERGLPVDGSSSQVIRIGIWTQGLIK